MRSVANKHQAKRVVCVAQCKARRGVLLKIEFVDKSIFDLHNYLSQMGWGLCSVGNHLVSRNYYKSKDSKETAGFNF